MNSEMKAYIGRGLGVSRTQEPGCVTSWCGSVHPPGSSLNPLLMGFLWSFLMQAQLIIKSISNLSLLSRELGVDLKLPSFQSWLGLPGDQYSSRSHPGALPKLPHQNKRCSSHPGNYKGFGSFLSGMEGRGRERDQVCIPYYESQYHIVFSVFWFSPTSFAGGTAACKQRTGRWIFFSYFGGWSGLKCSVSISCWFLTSSL